MPEAVRECRKSSRGTTARWWRSRSSSRWCLRCSSSSTVASRIRGTPLVVGVSKWLFSLGRGATRCAVHWRGAAHPVLDLVIALRQGVELRAVASTSASRSCSPPSSACRYSSARCKNTLFLAVEDADHHVVLTLAEDLSSVRSYRERVNEENLLAEMTGITRSGSLRK